MQAEGNWLSKFPFISVSCFIKSYNLSVSHETLCIILATAELGSMLAMNPCDMHMIPTIIEAG